MFEDGVMEAQQCATPRCGNRARWHSIPEGNRWGNEAPRRCADCCDAIGDAAAVLTREDEGT